MRGQKVRTFTLKNLVEKKKSSRILRVEDSVIRVRVPSLGRELGPALGNEDPCATIKTKIKTGQQNTHTQNQLLLFIF